MNKLTLYQKYRRFKAGNRKYLAVKNKEKRIVYAASTEHAQLKYPTWSIFKAPLFFAKIYRKTLDNSKRRVYILYRY